MRNREYRITLPADDPRFTDLRGTLDAVQVRGKYSPAPRMLCEWALLGYLLSTGKLVIGGEMSQAVEAAQQDMAAVEAAQAHVVAALGDISWE